MFYTYKYTQYIFYMPYSAHDIIYTALSTLYWRARHPDFACLLPNSSIMMTTIKTWMCLFGFWRLFLSSKIKYLDIMFQKGAPQRCLCYEWGGTDNSHNVEISSIYFSPLREPRLSGHLHCQNVTRGSTDIAILGQLSFENDADFATVRSKSLVY